MRYFVDTRIMEVVPEDRIEFFFMAPELYYEYKRGEDEAVIHEVWRVGENEVLDFSVAVDEPNKAKAREEFFNYHNCTPWFLETYIVPPSWYDKIIDNIKK